MKNAIKCFALVGIIAMFAACKNDKPTVTDNSVSATTASLTTPASTTPQGIAASAATAVAEAPQTAKASVSSPTTVAPNANQISQPAENPVNKTNGKVTSIKFEEMSFDWGKIKEGDKMTHIFKFKNTGDNDLVITDAHGSCGCTVPEWPKEPIKPGKGGDMKVVFNSEHKSGAQSKTVTITANTEPANVVLMIKGIVDPKEEAAKSTTN